MIIVITVELFRFIQPLFKYESINGLIFTSTLTNVYFFFISPHGLLINDICTYNVSWTDFYQLICVPPSCSIVALLQIRTK